MKKYIFLIIIFFLPVKAVFQVISQPGLYQLGENVTYSPAGPNDVIFQITASNVEFDLGDRFITQNAANIQTGLIAIQVASGLSNVVIKSGTNGSIQNIRGTGIQVLSNCSRIILDNITTFSCETRAIDFVGTSGNTITDSAIRNCSVIQCCQSNASTSAVNLAFCSRFIIEKLYAGNNGDIAHNMSVINLDNSNQGLFRKVLIENSVANTALRGMLFTTCVGCVLTDCLMDSGLSVGNNASCTGFELSTTSSNNIFLNCVASKMTAIVGVAANANGFISLGADNLFLNCLVKEFNGTTNQCFTLGGASARRIMFVDCLSSNNTSTTNACVSFRTFGAFITYIRCKSISNTSTGNQAVGFDINNGNDNTVIYKCLASRSVGSSAANSIYYRLIGSTNTIAVKNVASRNADTTTLFSGFAAGAINISAPGAVNSALLGPWTNLGIS